MVELRQVVCLLPHATGPSDTLATHLANHIDKIDHLDHHLLAGGDVVRQTDLALAARSQDDARNLELMGKLLGRC